MQKTKGVFAIFLVFFDSCQNRIYFMQTFAEGLRFAVLEIRCWQMALLVVISYIAE